MDTATVSRLKYVTPREYKYKDYIEFDYNKYGFTEDLFKGEENAIQYGFVAQEFQKIFPELVSEDSLGLLSVDYISIIPILVDAYQQQQIRIENAMICIYDLTGKQLKCIPIYEKGEVETIIHAEELEPGMYLYSLLVDGQLIDTKTMVLTE